MKIFDTHAHYDSEQFEPDRDSLLSAVTGLAGCEITQKTGRPVKAFAAEGPEAKGAAVTRPAVEDPAAEGAAGEGSAAGEREDAGTKEDPLWQVCAVVNVGAAFEGAQASLALAHRYPGVYAACGVHPDEVGELEEDGADAGSRGAADLALQRQPADRAGMEPGGKFALLEQLCRDPKCVAVGEIGLDYHWMVRPKELQQKWFIRQLALSRKLHLPVNVHSRDAAADTFEIIRAYHAHTGEGGIIHCYSGSVEMAREYVKLGYHIGIGGVVTFKNGRVLKEVVRQLPIERLVTETDCPYLAPQPFRGKRNDSRYIRYVAEAIAGLKEMDLEEAAERLFRNALQVYRLG